MTTREAATEAYNPFMGITDGMSISVPVALGVRVNVSPSGLVTAGRSLQRPSIFRGECLLIDRWSGLALDSTTDAHPDPGLRPVMWTVHGGPWQRWRLRRAANRSISITSSHSGLSLTTDSPPSSKSWIWLDRYRGAAEQKWQVHRSPDGLAYQVSASNTRLMLDADREARIPAAGPDHDIDDPTSPLLYTNWGGRNQEWSILRVS